MSKCWYSSTEDQTGYTPPVPHLGALPLPFMTIGIAHGWFQSKSANPQFATTIVLALTRVYNCHLVACWHSSASPGLHVA